MKLGIKKTEKIFLLLFLIFVLGVSCQNKKNIPEKPEQSINHNPSQEDKNQLVFGSARPKEAPVSDLTSRGFTETDRGDIKGQLLPLVSIVQIPEDMVIGPLQNIRLADTGDVSFLSAVTSFFKEAEKGIISDDVLHPEWKDSIRRVLGTELVKSEYSLRIGKIVSEEGLKRANIRIISNIGRISGEVMADYYEGRWLLSSISVDFAQLHTLYVRENIEFSPLGYSNILLNY